MSPLMRFPESTACSFTGHRPERLGIRRDDALSRRQLEERLWNEIVRLHREEGVAHFFSGMARGVDLWAARLVLWLQKGSPSVTLHCILPCQEQDKGWPEADSRLYHKILLEATEVVCLSDLPYTPGCMQARNRYLVERAETLLAVYDGAPGGGTAYTVDYAHRLRRRIVLLPPTEPPRPQ
ncbi:MAG: DUF1273 family protein [Clostridia bacterium]|nr:DUF1273 family protein [Clostridia bacterium]